MPWSSGAGSGFTTGDPWLRLGPDAETRNVAAQISEPTSILSAYRRLIALRAATPALQVGAFHPESQGAGDVVAYTRELPDQVILVVLDLGRKGSRWHLPRRSGVTGWRTLFGTSPAMSPDEVLPPETAIVLGPDGCLILEGIR